MNVGILVLIYTCTNYGVGGAFLSIDAHTNVVYCKTLNINATPQERNMHL